MADPVAIGNATLYHGDCLELVPSLSGFDAVITDPPYPDIDKGFRITDCGFLGSLPQHQFVFWSATEPFPLDWTGVHIWHKPNGNSSQHYERIFERNGQKPCKVFREAAILPNYVQFKREAVDHPTQKPVRLMQKLCRMTKGTILDPFMGSGTTGVAAAHLGRPFIGVEWERRFFDMACERISAAQAQQRLFA